MGLLNADLCKSCGQRRTKDPSGLCSHCRRLKGRVTCRICGQITTQAPDGICHICRSKIEHNAKHADADTINKAINDVRTLLFILEKRKEGYSFGVIGEMTGLRKGTVYKKYTAAVGQKILENAIDDKDGTPIF